MDRPNVPTCKTCSELTDSADGDNRCYNPLNCGIGKRDQSIEVDPNRDFCSHHSELRKLLPKQVLRG